MTRSRTRVETRTREKTQTRIREAGLTNLEEQVLRMHHGIALPEDAPLEFRGEDDPQVHAELVAMERRAIAHMARPDDQRRKQAIIDELQGL